MAATSSRPRSGGHGRQRSATAKAKSASEPAPRRGPAGGARKPAGGAKKVAAKTKDAASKTTEAVKEATPSVPKPNKFARKLAAKAAKKAGSKMLELAAERLRTIVDRAAETGHVAVDKTAHQRLPIQVAIDVAVPLRVAWEEWMTFECLPEGVHNVSEIERDGDMLFGHTSGRRSKDWEAEILDERERQSFAWQSHEGSDCAGLATFHELSDRLTRIELNLDVVPTSVPETFELAVHLADKYAQAELRRFKARLELINPDLYEEDEPEDEDEPEPEPEDDRDLEPDEDLEDEADDEDEPEDPEEQDEAA